MRMVEVTAVDGVVDRQGFHVFAGVEIAGGQGFPDHRLLRRVGILAAERVHEPLGVDLVEGDGAHHLVGFDLGAVEGAQGFLAQFGERLLRRIV